MARPKKGVPRAPPAPPRASAEAASLACVPGDRSPAFARQGRAPASVSIIRGEPPPSGRAAGRSRGCRPGAAAASSELCSEGLCPKLGLSLPASSPEARFWRGVRNVSLPLAPFSAPGRSPEDEGVLAAEAFPRLLGTFFCSLLPVLCSEDVCGFGS